MPAEQVAMTAIEQAQRYLDSGAAAGPHLADQIVLPLTQSGGAFLTLPPTDHFKTNIEVLAGFFELDIRTRRVDETVMIECEVAGIPAR